MSADREPIVLADAGPLIRLAAAGLLDTLRGLNRRIVLVDRVEDEVVGDPQKPFAAEIRAWIERMGEAILRARTVEGAGIEALRGEAARSAEDEALLRRSLRDSGERALREFVERFEPDEVRDAVVVYEDRDTANLLAASRVPLTAMTTRRFVRLLNEWGVNVDAVAALEAVAERYNLKPALQVVIEPDPPSAK